MNITRWEPFRELEDAFRQYSPLFGRSLRRLEAGNWMPVADISETDREYVIKAELPEVKREDVKITLDNGMLTISGELLGSAPGVGYEIANAQAFYDNTRMYAYVIVSAVLGLIVNGGFWALQRRLLRWHPSVRGEARS